MFLINELGAHLVALKIALIFSYESVSTKEVTSIFDNFSIHKKEH